MCYLSQLDVNVRQEFMLIRGLRLESDRRLQIRQCGHGLVLPAKRTPEKWIRAAVSRIESKPIAEWHLDNVPRPSRAKPGAEDLPPRLFLLGRGLFASPPPQIC